MPGAVPSPSRVSAQINLATSRLYRRARSASTSLQLHQVTSRVPIVRQAISNVVTVDGIATGAELLMLMNKLIPRTYPVSSPPGSMTDRASYIFLEWRLKLFYILSTANHSTFQTSLTSSRSKNSGNHSSLGLSSP